jgi:hypothetical protein
MLPRRLLAADSEPRLSRHATFSASRNKPTYSETHRSILAIPIVPQTLEYSSRQLYATFSSHRFKPLRLNLAMAEPPPKRQRRTDIAPTREQNSRPTTRHQEDRHGDAKPDRRRRSHSRSRSRSRDRDLKRRRDTSDRYEDDGRGTRGRERSGRDRKCRLHWTPPSLMIKG